MCSRRGLLRAVWGSGKGWLGGARARGGVPRASVPGGVGGRGTGPRDGANFATCVVFLCIFVVSNAYKRRRMAFLGCPVGWGGGTHRSWPGGRGGRPRALVAGEGWGGRRGWMERGLVGCSKEGQVQARVGLLGSSTGGGKGSGGNPRASVPEG